MIFSALQKIGMYPIGKWPPPPILPFLPSVSVVDNRLNSLQMEEGAELLPIQNTALVQVFISGFKLSTFFAEGWDVLSWAPTANCRLSVEQCADGGGGWAVANPQDCFGPGGHLKIQFVMTSFVIFLFLLLFVFLFSSAVHFDDLDAGPYRQDGRHGWPWVRCWGLISYQDVSVWWNMTAFNIYE